MALDAKTEKALRILLNLEWVKLLRLSKRELLRILQPDVNNMNL